jgi:hypothetical protein
VSGQAFAQFHSHTPEFVPCRSVEPSFRDGLRDFGQLPYQRSQHSMLVSQMCTDGTLADWFEIREQFIFFKIEVPFGLASHPGPQLGKQLADGWICIAWLGSAVMGDQPFKALEQRNVRRVLFV